MSRIKIPMDLRSWKPTFRNKRERWPTRQCEQRMCAKRNVGRTLLSVAFDPDLDLDLDLDCPSILRLFLVSGPDQGQKRRTGVSVPQKPSAPGVPHPSFRVLCEKRACPERSRRDGDFDFPSRESNSQRTYARGIPPFATNAKDGHPALMQSRKSTLVAVGAPCYSPPDRIRVTTVIATTHSASGPHPEGTPACDSTRHSRL